MKEKNKLNQNIKGRNKKKSLLIAIIILLLLGLTYYIFFIKNKGNKIDYEIKRVTTTVWDEYNLYVNGVATEIKSYEVPLKITEFNDLLIAEGSKPGEGDIYYIVDENGKQINLNFDSKYPNGYDEESKLINKCSIDRVFDKEIYMSCTRFSQGDIYYFCDLDPDDIITYKQKFEYLGNGKFSNGIIINEGKVSEHKFDLKCEDR